MNPKRRGKEAEKAFLDYWQRRGYHVERIRDRSDLVGLNKGLRLADFKKPSDFLVSGPRLPLHYAEVKSTDSPDAFPFSNIEAGQSVAAKLEANHGAGAYKFYIWSSQRMKWYIMDCRQYVKVLDEGRRSVKFEELEIWHK